MPISPASRSRARSPVKLPAPQRVTLAIALAIALHLVLLAVLVRPRVREAGAKEPTRLAVTIGNGSVPPPERPTTPAPSVRARAQRPSSVAPAPPAPPRPADVAVPLAPDESAAADGPVGPRQRSQAKDRLGDAIRGSAQGPQPSMATLEGATGISVVGRESDSARAQRLAKANLTRDLAAHDVGQGLADDWLGRKRAEVERIWHPQERELNDGGKEVRATALVARTLLNPLLWKEANKAIAGEGSALAQTMTDFDRARAIEEMMTPPVKSAETDAERRQRLFASLHTNREAFMTKVGLEVTVRHRSDGTVESIEVTARSGQRDIDAGVAEAIARAWAMDPGDAAPSAIARGKPFVSRWALEVTWEVRVPKISVMMSSESATAWMAEGRSVPIGIGTSFGNHGVDVPFTVHQSKHVELIAIESLEDVPVNPTAR